MADMLTGLRIGAGLAAVALLAAGCGGGADDQLGQFLRASVALGQSPAVLRANLENACPDRAGVLAEALADG